MARRAGGGLGLALAAGVALYLLSSSSNAGDEITIYPDGSAELPPAAEPPVDDVVAAEIAAGDTWDAAPPDMSAPDPIASFLFMIRSCEHNALDVLSGDCYRTFYGGSRFSDMSDHPVATGEKVGIKLPSAMCVAAGIASGNCVSTAAGAYQMTLPTWRRAKAALGLADFSNASQDAAAAWLMDQARVTPLILSGDVAAAVRRASSTWASLPGSTAQQGGRSIAFAIDRFNIGQSAQTA